MFGSVNYRDPELRDLLAGEYVLGTLVGRARRRFERLLREDFALRDEVTAWERRLSPLVDAVQPVAPPKRVWQQIEQRVAPPAPKRASLWDRVGFWRPLGLLASTAFVLVVGYLVVVSTQEVEAPPAPIAQAPAAEYVALLNDEKAQPAWVVSAADFSQITVKALRAPPSEPDKAYELWLLPGENQPPRSLGLLPTEGTKTVAVPEEIRQAMAAGKVLAVSVEPPGGSPTGLPTGPVLYQGSLIATG